MHESNMAFVGEERYGPGTLSDVKGGVVV